YGIRWDTLAQFPAYDLRLHRLIWPRAAFFHKFLPLGLGLLSLFKKSLVMLLEQRQQCPNGAFCVSHEADVGGMAKTDALRIDIDLYTLDRSWLRQKFDI